MIGFSSIKKLFGGLTRTREELTKRLTQAYRGGRLDESRLASIEEALIAADLGVETAGRVVEAVRARARGKGGDLGEEELRELVGSELAASFEELQGGSAERETGAPASGGKPRVGLLGGVNGGGKTTTVAKLAARWGSEGSWIAWRGSGFRVGGDGEMFR